MSPTGVFARSIATLAAIVGHADLRSVMKYVHVRQDALDWAMDDFGKRVKALDEVRCSFGAVGSGEKRDAEGLSGMEREVVSDRKIN